MPLHKIPPNPPLERGELWSLFSNLLSSPLRFTLYVLLFTFYVSRFTLWREPMKAHRSCRNFVFALLAVILILAFCADRSFALTENLIKNPGAEESNSYWHLHECWAVGQGHDGRYSHSGNNWWFGGTDDDSSSAWQDVDVSRYAEAIDTGNVDAILGGWLGAWGSSDRAELIMQFLSAAGTKIGGDHQSGSYTGDWTPVSITRDVPGGTRKIRVHMYFWYSHGDWNDGYLDDLYLLLDLPTFQKPSQTSLNFGNLYLGTNKSATDYNRAIKKTLSFTRCVKWWVTPMPGPAGPNNEYFTILDENVDNVKGSLTGGASNAVKTTDAYTGGQALRVDTGGKRPTTQRSHDHQKYNGNMGWNSGSGFSIVANPTAPNQFRYITFAWRKDDGKGIMLQLHGSGNWNHRYHAGENVYGLQPSKRVSDLPAPGEWSVYTRDLYADWGAFTLTGIAFTTGDGSFGYWDHMYLHKSPELPYPDWMKLSKPARKISSATYDVNQEVKVWLEPTSGTGTYSGSISLNTTNGNAIIPVSAVVHPVGSPPNLATPVPGSNGKVNVPVKESVRFQVAEGSPHYPGATMGDRYLWKKVTGSDPPGTGFEATTTPERNYTFDNPGDYTIYAKWVDSNGVESDPLAILVRVWNRPVVKAAPPSGTVSWRDGKYVGVVDQPVGLAGDGETRNSATDEYIARYKWDLDSGSTFEQLVEPQTFDGTVEDYFSMQPFNNMPADEITVAYWMQVDAPTTTRTYGTPISYAVAGEYNEFAIINMQGGGIYMGIWIKGDLVYTWDPSNFTPLYSNDGQLHHMAVTWRSSDGKVIIYVDGTKRWEDTVAQGQSITSGGALVLGQEQDSLGGGFQPEEAFAGTLDHVAIWDRALTGSEIQQVMNQTPSAVHLSDLAGLWQYALEYTWSAPSLNERIRCRAVTNYGIESDEKLFDLKIYDSLKVDPDGPYTGRPTRPVELIGSVNKMSYPGASFEYQWHVRTNGDFIEVDTTSDGKAEYSWTTDGDYQARFGAEVTTSEGLVLTGGADVVVAVEAGRPTAMPDGPYRGGIHGGNFSPVQFEGNPPDFIEAQDIGIIQDWLWYFPDRTGMALQLDGADDYIQAPAIQERSVEMWVKPNAPAQMGLYSGDADYNVFIYEPEGIAAGSDFDVTYGLYVDFYGDAIAVPFNDIEDGWHHIAISWDGGTDLRVGIDGQFPDGYVRDGASWVEHEQPFILTGTPQPGLSANTLIGKTTFSAWNTGSQYFNGTIDEVAIWDEELNVNEIWDHISGEVVLTDEPVPVLYLNLKEGEGDIAHDLSTSGNHGTLVNMEPESWVLDGHPEVAHGIWNPTHAYRKAGKYDISLRVLSEYGKWGWAERTEVKVVDGKITGYVRAADLRTPVKESRLTLTSSHVNPDVLAVIADSDPLLNTTVLSSGERAIYTETDENGYYIFEHVPLGSYRVIASKLEGETIHEFETSVKATELTLDAPNQLGIDFVDLSVFPISGRVVYSIQKNGVDVLVQDAVVEAQAVGSTNSIKSLPSSKSGDATGGNYSLPLFSGKYLFIANREGHDIRIKEDTPDYDSTTGLVTIDRARTDIDFIDRTTRELTVFVKDSGGYAMPGRKVTISGDNGQAEGKSDEADGKLVATLNPGVYTVTVPGAMPEGEKEEKPAEVDLTSGDRTVTMVIPVKIELSLDPKPKFFDASDEFLAQFGLKPEDNPEGYMYYYPPEPRTHTYTVTATANGKTVGDFMLFVTDEVSMMTDDPPSEQEMFVECKEGEECKGEYTITAGKPKLKWVQVNDESIPLADTKKVTFRAEKDGYLASDPLDDLVTVLGDLSEGTAAKIVSIPVVNYTVLHDPPGDGSYAYLDDSMTIKGIVFDMEIEINDVEIPVYPSPWSKEREISEYKDNLPSDLGSSGLLGYRDSDPAAGHFTWTAIAEVGTGAGIVALGPVGYAFQVAKVAVKTGGMAATNMVQYEVSPNRHLETPSGDELPDLLGPGKGDVYYGEGWTLGLQTKYRLGIQQKNGTWELTTAQVQTYDILERTNQYIYTIRDIENVIEDLEKTINDPKTTDEKEKKKLEDAKSTWEGLLDKNLAYVWNRDYISQGKSFADFESVEGSSLGDSETLIFSAGPTFEYSRAISAATSVTFSVEVGAESGSELSHEFESKVGALFFGTGATVNLKTGSAASIESGTDFGAEWESGQSTEQSVGFVLSDDDIGDNISTRVYADPVWGTPLFFQDPGSVTSDPWELGTNKGIDVKLELLEGTVSSGPFDYTDGAHYKVKVTYEGMRELETDEFDFELLAPPTDNPDNTYVEFNGYWGPYPMELAKGQETAIVGVSVFPPKQDMGNSEEKEYSLAIQAKESADDQISRSLDLKVKFADLRAPRATIVAPYAGQRISPVLFPETDPFDIQVISEDMDIASIQLQIRTKQPDSVWEPWRNLSGMVWKDGEANPNVEVFDRPSRREFTFKWTENEIKSLGVGEYALRAVATDRATKPNVDIDPPDVVFLVDDSEPTVLTTLPDYQARESQRIYRGELSAIFTDDMRADDFSDRTFAVTDLLKGSQKVAGFVSYSPALRKAVFVPIVPFDPNGFYRVEIKTDTYKADGSIDQRGVHDLAGNPLDNAFMWTFRTTDAPFEPTWSITLRATDGISTDANNIAAVEYGAEDGEDERDARAVPSFSQMSLSFLDKDKVRFDRDIRPADGRLSHHWFFVIGNAASGSEVAIYYKPSIKLIRTERQYQVLRLIEFDADGNVTNMIPLDPSKAPIDPDTGEIGEMEAYRYTNAGEASRYFRLDVQKANLVATEFQKGSSGWRFFSAPIAPQRADPFVNLGDDIDPFQMYGYDTRNSAYKIYPLDIGEVSLQTGHGYFTRLDDDVEVDVGGASNLEDATLELEAAGWHAIGNPFILPVNVADLKVNGQVFDAAVTAGLIEGTLYRWKIDADPVSNPDAYEEVTNASQLSPWDGCWLKTKQANLILTIPAPANIASAQIDLPDSFDPPMAPSAPLPSPVSQSQFDLRLELVSSFSADMTTALGTRRDAQVDWDNFDQGEPPMLDQTVAVYFDHPDWADESGLYNRDYQPVLKAGEQRTWNFTVYTDRPDTEMVLSWEESISQVPGDVMLYFRQVAQTSPLPKGATLFNSPLTKGARGLSLPVDDGQSEWQDMREVRSVDLISRLQFTKIPFEVRAQRFEMSPPSDVRVIAGEKQVTLRWKADDNEFIESHVITRQNGSAEDWMLDTGCWILDAGYWIPDAGYTPGLTGGSSSSGSGMGVKSNTPKGDKGDGRSSSRYVLQQIPGNPVSEFVDTDVLEEATYTYQVSVGFKSGAELRSDLFTVRTLPVIERTALLQSYPNPFNPEVWIPYELAEESSVSIRIHNTSGQLVRVLDLGVQPRGRYISREKAAHWDGHTQTGERAASGVYFYVLRAGRRFTAAKKMVILK
jgi:hypothetical protein